MHGPGLPTSWHGPGSSLARTLSGRGASNESNLKPTARGTIGDRPARRGPKQRGSLEGRLSQAPCSWHTGSCAHRGPGPGSDVC